MTFEVGKLPEYAKTYTRRRGGKHSALIDALLALSEGQAIKVPCSEFRSPPAVLIGETVKRVTSRTMMLRQRRDGDHYWLWLEPSGRVEKASEDK